MIDLASAAPLVGIDYGSNLAGTTVVAVWREAEGLQLFQSEKKRPADAFLLDLLPKLDAKQVFLDAPLSLPHVYRRPETADPDFFFRRCDRELKCMSPLFLGGLTARAMKLRHNLPAIEFVETYPAFHARRLALNDLAYKKETSAIPAVLDRLQLHFPFALPEAVSDWHQVDALLALLSAVRAARGKAKHFGAADEGVIVV